MLAISREHCPTCGNHLDTAEAFHWPGCPEGGAVVLPYPRLAGPGDEIPRAPDLYVLR